MLLLRLPTTRVRGMVRYSFLDANDRPTFARDQRGERIWGGHWSPNLITNVGMDALRSERITSYAGVSLLSPTYRTTLRLGTGSTAPAFTDTVLASEVLTSTSSGGFSNANAYPDAVGSEITASYQITRVAEVSAATNFTEYGFSGLTADLNIRELFRDEHGDPTTISIVAGKKLRVDHTLLVTIPWGAIEYEFDIEEYDAADALIATHAITADCLFVATSSAARARMFKTALPMVENDGYDYKVGGAFLTAGSTDPLTEHPSYTHYTVAYEAYVAGSFVQRGSFTVPEAVANGNVMGFALSPSNILGADIVANGYRVVFKSPASFTKVDTHTLTFACDWSWARG